jgi:TonB family protein
MSPRSLLFSSDQETARLLKQALYELDFNVEHCTEIFAAVEKVTTQGFDLIVAEWGDGLEASFLLKTSRELKMNHGAITVAVTNGAEAASAARQTGVGIVVAQPVIVEKAKFTLLSSDIFLQGLRSWLPKLTIQPASVQSVSPPPPSFSLLSDTDEGEAETASQPRTQFWPYLVKAARGKSPRRSSKGQHWTRLITLAFALGIALSSAGYVFSAPMHSREIATSMQQIVEKAVVKTEGWLHNSDQDMDDDSVEVAQNSGPASKRGVTHIRVTPVHEYSEPVVVPPLMQPDPPPQDSQPEPEYRAVAVATIPDSLRSPAQSIHNAAVRATPSLLGGVEPVSVSQDLAEKLLLEKTEPSYPRQALQAGLQGPVVLQAWIARDGSIRDLKLIRGSLLLGQAAYSAVKQWKYRPYLLNGQAVETQTYVTVNFTLP